MSVIMQKKLRRARAWLNRPVYGRFRLYDSYLSQERTRQASAAFQRLVSATTSFGAAAALTLETFRAGLRQLPTHTYPPEALRALEGIHIQQETAAAQAIIQSLPTYEGDPILWMDKPLDLAILSTGRDAAVRAGAGIAMVVPRAIVSLSLGPSTEVTDEPDDAPEAQASGLDGV